MSASSNNPIQQVGEFMSTFGQRVVRQPRRDINAKEAALRFNLIFEELCELAEAMGYEVKGYAEIDLSEDQEVGAVDPVAALDALTDLRYVVYGAYHTLGLSSVADEAFEEVHSSNMSKGVRCPQCDGDKKVHQTMESLEECHTCRGQGVIAMFNEHGKIVKPSTYRKPNLEQFIK